MVDQFGDPSIPATAWDYLTVDTVAPDRIDANAGTPLEIQKLATGLVNYYAARDIYFDADAFGRDISTLFAIERGDAN
jgi:hypothetical protein